MKKFLFTIIAITAVLISAVTVTEILYKKAIRGM